VIEIRYVQYDDQHKQHIQLIRNTVFTNEQNVDPNIDFDGQDIEADHVLILINALPIATGRMLKDGHIGRVAVLAEHRGASIGTKVIEALENLALDADYPRIYLGAQLHAIPFYRKLGFSPFGEQYVEANIEHISMEKTLS
jgi:predicted GNAT family N-acyltransferase